MIKAIETTFQEPQYNHTYLLSDDKMHVHGYIRFGGVIPFFFKQALKFNPKGRTFKIEKVKLTPMPE